MTGSVKQLWYEESEYVIAENNYSDYPSGIFRATGFSNQNNNFKTGFEFQPLAVEAKIPFFAKQQRGNPPG